MEPEYLDTKSKQKFTVRYNTSWGGICFGIQEAKLVKSEVKKVFPKSKVYLKRHDTVIIQIELRGYDNKLIWKTMQRNLLYPGQMYENKDRALKELRETLNKFTIPIDEYHGDHHSDNGNVHDQHDLDLLNDH